MKTVVRCLNILIIGVLCLCTLANKQEPVADYYWRDYSGIIPIDAVPGGLDMNNATTYIGQGLVKDVGSLPGVIYPGERTMKVAYGGVRTVDTDIKILCSPVPFAFQWLPANISNFFVVTINKYLIRGGYENSYLVYIGRIAYQGQVLIGKIVTSLPDFRQKAPMFYAYKDQELRQDYYEVLMYDNDISHSLDERMNQ